LTESDFETFLKTLHREEMEFVIIGGRRITPYRSDSRAPK